MNLLKPQYQIWEQEDMWEHIAKCTRVCYQTDVNPNKPESGKEFVERVILHSSSDNFDINRIHGAMLEHGTVYLTFYHPTVNEYFNTITKYFNESHSRVIKQGDSYFVTTNYRVIVENDWKRDLIYQTEYTKYHHRRITVCFRTNIGVSRELNRHRVNSIAEESTRYCNYTKDKFTNQINYVLPTWFNTEEDDPYIESHKDKISSYCEDVINMGDEELLNEWCDIDFYLFALITCEFCYKKLIDKGWRAQEAREVLPLATKTQLVHTAFIDDWIHFFKLRAIGVSGAPHPNVKNLITPLMTEFKLKFNIKI